MSKIRPIVCIFAHPDDEAFGPGGAIATFARKQPVYLICVTKGDAVEEHCDKPYKDLRSIRRKELMASAKILGITKVFFLDYSDGTLCNNLYHQVAQDIWEIIEKLRPETLLTFEPRGVTGHIDHIVVSMTTSFVFAKAPFVSTLLYYCQREGIIKKLREIYFIHVPQGYDAKEIDMIIDVSSVWQMKLRAMRAHASQQRDVETILRHQQGEKKEEHFLVVKK